MYPSKLKRKKEGVGVDEGGGIRPERADS